jgi:hypothetical protein
LLYIIVYLILFNYRASLINIIVKDYFVVLIF